MKEYQKILFPYAYNILGSAEDAKDAIQEVLSRYIAAPRTGIENEKGYLIKSVINQSITIRNRRKKINEGEVWLPEPFATEEADTNIHLKEIVSYSMLVLLEQLNPKERAVFILKEGFGYSHEEIAEVLSATVEHSRKLLSRAKAKLERAQTPAKTTPGETLTIELLEKYVDAIRARDTRRLESLLTDDISFFADGGGKMNVVKKICTGVHEVSDLLVYVYDKFQTAYTTVHASINHQPAILYYDGTQLKTCQVLDVVDGRIRRINTIIDPQKLKSLEGARMKARMI